MKKKVFLSFLMPYPIRSIEAPYLWVFYKQLTSFSVDEIIFVGSSEYKKDPLLNIGRFEIQAKSCELNKYKIPTIENINKYVFYEFPKEIFNQLNYSYNNNSSKIFNELLTKEILEIEQYLENIIAEIIDNYEILAILSWCNFPSLKKISKKYNLSIIHNELGALREPYFLPTAYFDLSGVNGNTESKSRFKIFNNEYIEEKIYTIDEIRDIIMNVDFKSKNKDFESNVGIALQVEDDSNILAFSNEFDSISLIRWVKDKYKYKDKKYYIREHPASHLKYNKLGDIDISSSSISFISKCKNIVTINSSLALEALLFEKDVEILGDSPFSFIVQIDDYKKKLLAINFVIFGYLIPYELLFDYKYYVWRLTKPSEKDIVNKHIEFYKLQIQNREKKELIEEDNNLFFIQLFIENENGIIEENSIKFPVFLNDQIQKFEFDLSDNLDIKNLRLDPLNDSCVIEIEKMYLILDDDIDIDLISNISSNVCSHHGKSYFFESFDPQMYFTNIDLTKISISKFIIELRYIHISKNAVHVCANQIVNDKNFIINIQEQDIENLNDKLTKKEQDIENLNDKLTKKEQDIENLNGKIISIEDELVTIYTSKSWQITKPLRNIIRILKNIK